MATSNTTLDAIVGELALLEGRRQSDLTHVTVLTPPRRAPADRRDETLFAFLDLGGGGTGALARVMLEKLSQVYWHAAGPVTSALRQAVGVVNDHLLEENRLLAAGQRRQGGLVCAVLREDNLYLAQIGPAKALLAQGTGTTQIPTESTTDATLLTPPTRLPLGVSRGLDIHFSHSYLSAGDRMLLTGESWSREVPVEMLTQALETGGDAKGIMRALEQKVGQATFSALIVEWASDVAIHAPVEVLPSTAGMDPPPATGAPEADMRVELWEDAVSTDHEGQRRRFPNPLSGLTLPREQLDRAWQGLRKAGMALSSGAHTLLTRVLPEPEPEPPPRRRRRVSAENVPVMVAIAVAIPLLVAFVVVTFYLQRSESARREGLMRQAQEAIEAARQADESAARERWGEALVAAQEALGAAPDDAEVVALRNEARDILNALDRVFYPQLNLLWDYGPGQDRRLAAARLQVYVLDAEQDQVTRHTLDQESATADPLTLVAYRGERVGDAIVDELLDVVWLEAGGGWGRDVLLILTGDHQILQYNLSWGVSWVPFDLGLAHVNGRVMQPFDGKLYVLDPEHSQVWRFPTTGEGFGPPEGYFAAAAPDLSAAVDMVIDGAVYVLLKDGRIYKFFGGEAQPFQPVGLPQSLGNPVALAVEGDAAGGALYVADADARAIVALDKNGQFIHQIKAEGDVWAGLEALDIEENSRTLYALATGRLYALPLPPLPESE